MHTQFCKNLLGVHKSTSTSAVLGEMGRSPIQLDAEYNMIKYWLHIHHTTKNHLLKEILMDIQTQQIHQKSWLQNILKLLNNYGFSYIFHNPTTVNPDSFLPQLRQRMSDTSRQVWQSQINNNDKLTVYRQVKTQFQREPYLDTLSSQHRRTFSKLRMSAHCLAIERGRYSNPKTPQHLRFCKCCHPTQHVEDETHFIIFCPKYTVERQTFLSHLSGILQCSVNDLKLDNLVTLLGSHNPDVIKISASFLHTIYITRMAL
jgi:hypothetical protein